MTLPHDALHRIVQVEFVRHGGWAVAVAEAEGGGHYELRLARGEGPVERLGCWEDSREATPRADPDDAGIALDEVARMVAHAAWHVATDVPPSGCGGGVGDETKGR